MHITRFFLTVGFGLHNTFFYSIEILLCVLKTDQATAGSHLLCLGPISLELWGKNGVKPGLYSKSNFVIFKVELILFTRTNPRKCMILNHKYSRNYQGSLLNLQSNQTKLQYKTAKSCLIVI